MRRITWRWTALVACETAVIAGALGVAVRIRLGAIEYSISGYETLLKVLLIAGVSQLCLYFGDVHDRRIVADRREFFVRVLQGLGCTSLILAVVYFWFPFLIIGRGVFLIGAGFVAASVVGWRVTFDWIAHRVGPRERLLLVGTNAAAVALARELHERRELGIEIVGFIDPDPSRIGAPVLNPRVIGAIEDIPEITRSRAVDRVVVSLADARGKLPMDKLLDMKLDKGVAFDHLASVYEEYTGKIALENLRPSWLIFSPGFRKSRWLHAAKRTLDIVAASVGLILSFPLMILVAATIKLTSRGSVLYHQTRVGQHNRVFTVHKFRTMRQDAEAETGAVWSKAGDERITPVGRFLRRTRLDELPQLWTVLQGHMSLVGPRPERPEFVQQLAEKIPFYGQRHVAKPGITGWAQVRYTYGASIEDAMEKLQYDLFYIKNMSVALDLFIMFETMKTVILRRGA